MDTENQTPQVVEPEASDNSAPTETSEASTQVSETPEVSQGIEEQQSPDVKAEDKVEEKLLAGKFKSPEDMEKAYNELQSQYTRSSQERAELSKILNEAFSQPEQPQQLQQQQDYGYEEVNPLQAEVDALKRNQAVSNFVFSHQDADAASMQKVLTEDPIVNQISGHEAKLEYAYLKSQNMSSPKAIAAAEKKAAQSTQAKIVEKQAAQVESANKSQKTDESSELRAIATGNYSQEQRTQARKAWIRKNLVDL